MAWVGSNESAHAFFWYRSNLLAGAVHLRGNAARGLFAGSAGVEVGGNSSYVKV